MRAEKFHFEILPKRLHLHVPNSNLLTKGQGDASRRARPHSPRAQNQDNFAKKVQHTNQRPERKNEGKAKAKALASTATKYGLIFGAGTLAGAVAHRRGWFGKMKFR